MKLNEILAPIRARLEALLAVVAEEFNVPSKELKGGVSTFAVLPARRVAVVLAVEFLNPPLHREVLAGWCGVREATLYRFQRRVREQERNDPAFARRLEILRGRARTAIKLTEGEVRTPAAGGGAPALPVKGSHGR